MPPAATQLISHPTPEDTARIESQRRWVREHFDEDDYGRDPAVRKPGTTVIAFPLTMISKRIERGENVNVRDLFGGVVDHLRRIESDPA